MKIKEEYLLGNLFMSEQNINSQITEYNNYVNKLVDYLKEQINKEFSNITVCEKDVLNQERNYLKGINGTFLPVVFANPLDLTWFRCFSQIKILLYRKNYIEECFEGVYYFLENKFFVFDDENLIQKYSNVSIKDILITISEVVGIKNSYYKYEYLGEI